MGVVVDGWSCATKLDEGFFLGDLLNTGVGFLSPAKSLLDWDLFLLLKMRKTVKYIS